MLPNWNWEQKALVDELNQGMELAKQLRVHMNAPSSAKSRELLLERILSSYEKALSILNWRGSEPESPPTTSVPESSSGHVSPDRGQQDKNDVSKKRKVLPTWTDQVRVCSENGTGGFADDGFSWRKYGQKDILGAKYLRNYYRCSYRSTQNCLATKQVQRSDNDPNVFELIYSGKHTCNQSLHTASPTPAAEAAAASLGKLEAISQNALFNSRTSLGLESQEMASHHPLNFPSTFIRWMDDNRNFTVPTQASHNNSPASFSPGFISPTASETNYFPVPPSSSVMNVSSLGWQHMESDLHEMISAISSVSNSSTVDMDFSIDTHGPLDYRKRNP